MLSSWNLLIIVSIIILVYWIYISWNVLSVCNLVLSLFTLWVLVSLIGADKEKSTIVVVGDSDPTIMTRTLRLPFSMESGETIAYKVTAPQLHKSKKKSSASKHLSLAIKADGIEVDAEGHEEDYHLIRTIQSFQAVQMKTSTGDDKYAMKNIGSYQTTMGSNINVYQSHPLGQFVIEMEAHNETNGYFTVEVVADANFTLPVASLIAG